MEYRPQICIELPHFLRLSIIERQLLYISLCIFLYTSVEIDCGDMEIFRFSLPVSLIIYLSISYAITTAKNIRLDWYLVGYVGEIPDLAV